MVSVILIELQNSSHIAPRIVPRIVSHRVPHIVPHVVSYMIPHMVPHIVPHIGSHIIFHFPVFNKNYVPNNFSSKKLNIDKQKQHV